jgi:hypothetical protein
MSRTRLALLSTAVSLGLLATPAVAQTFNGFYNKDPAVTRGYAPYERAPQAYNGGWSNGPPIVGPVVGVLTAPLGMATGGWGQPASGCYLDRDFNGRYTAICGM